MLHPKTKMSFKYRSVNGQVDVAARNLTAFKPTTVGQATSFYVGANPTLNDSTSIKFNNVGGTGSPSNTASLGLYNSPHLTVDGNGDVIINGNLSITGSFPVAVTTNWGTPGTIGSSVPNTGKFITLESSGQITSTLPNGTSPFILASWTEVPNLNSAFLKGSTWTQPGTIGSAVPNSGAFTTLNATTVIRITNVGVADVVTLGALQPNLLAGSSTLFTVGVAETSNNTGVLIYTRASPHVPNNPLNTIGIGLWGSSKLVVDGSGNATVNGNCTVNGNLTVTGTYPTVVWTTPGTIGSAVANTGSFTSLAANSLTLTNGASVNAATIQTYQPSLSVGNSTSYLLGVSAFPNNTAEITFNNTGGHLSPLNSIGLGVYAYPNRMTITQNLATLVVPLTAPALNFPLALGFPFQYAEGGFAPVFRYVTGAGATVPFATINYTYQTGYFTRIGNQVTVNYNIIFTSIGGDSIAAGAKMFAISGLPYKCKRNAGSLNMVQNSPMNSEFPDGYVGNVVGFAATTFARGRVASLYEDGALVPLRIYAPTGTAPFATWTADGTTMIVTGQCTTETPVYTLPNNAVQPIWNQWIVLDATLYSMEFSGSMTYYTDEPF